MLVCILSDIKFFVCLFICVADISVQLLPISMKFCMMVELCASPLLVAITLGVSKRGAKKGRGIWFWGF